jgi:hypothetical protein
MRRVIALLATSCVALGLTGIAAAVQPPTPPAPVAAKATSWADLQIRTVTAAGILGDDLATFRPADPLTRGELADALVAWGKPAATPADPSKLVTMSELDAKLVSALGLTPAARRIRIAARDAELAPTSRLGTEAVARLLGLRLNHPQGSDDLELLPSQPATRAEAAYSDPGNRRARLFTAAGSASETRHALRQAVAWRLVASGDAESAMKLVERIVAILWRMTRGWACACRGIRTREAWRCQGEPGGARGSQSSVVRVGLR